MGFSLAGLIRERAKDNRSKTAIVFQDAETSYGELDDRSSRAAQGLLDAGVAAQDRIAFLDKNCPEFFEILFGAAKINAVCVAVNWRLAPPEIAYVIGDAGAKVLFVGEEFLPQIDGVDLGAVEKVVVLGKDGSHERYADWISSFDAMDPGTEATPDDVAFQLYTSGTTGLPKGAMLTNHNFGTALAALSPGLGFRPDATNIVVMPVFHIAGSAWGIAGMNVGATNVLHRDVDPAAILDAIPRHGVTIALFVPAVIQFLLAHPDRQKTDFSTLETVVYGASPISEDVLRRAVEAFGCGFVQLYGLTETTGGFTMLRPEDHDPARPHLLRSCGRPYDWVELRIVDAATGEDVPPGAVGELWTRSGQNMKGYWGMDDATAATITTDGWLRTGDAGYVDDEGYVYLHDRLKDMVVSGGENVYPAEVENALMSHSDVADCAVIGVPHEKWGETVKAVVVRAQGSKVSEADLIAYARERLAHYKCPTSVDFTDAPLPRNPSGKLLKRVIREPYWAGQERRIH